MNNRNSQKVLIVAPFAFGYTAHIKNALDKFANIEANILYLDKPSFEYRNNFHKARNFISKIFGKNLKKTFVFDRVKKDVSALAKQNIIFVIRPDLLNDDTLKFLKNKTEKFIAYYYDSTRRFPRKVDIIPFFDTIYSYDKLDVNTYSFEFLTNYIFDESKNKSPKYLFFNISTNDYRFPLIETLAGYFKRKNWSYNIQVYNGSDMPAEHVKIITTQKSITEVSELIKASKIIVEIQRTEQVGLSFRIFEALGHRKKLITTNKDIVNYDFYSPQNILVVDEHDIKIPDEFVNSPYVEIEDSILTKYKIEHWVKAIFNP
ncbi:hypothetical protein [Ichthyenterobacterium magnum]|uniref:Lipopolysaccharide biosynthesis protein n=1 Tax=Ichthyenterobacterium magnum TaxID=1230530 RepID=A0A420DH01_9FLAO|nr:hypothetical protein [Ichthyenterobacterium magnum]RKE92364.1 hypothetical protein BXY80_2283 [Ichthyenterobacterium magnum]